MVGKELDSQNVELLGRGYATWLLQRKYLIVSWDMIVDYQVYEFRDAMVKGLIESGITVYDIGMTLSQIAYFACYVFRTRGMVMITASHNPKEYNGFKFGTGYSETMLTEEIIELRELVKSGKFVTRLPVGQVIKKDIKQEYIDDLKRRIDPIKKI